MGLVKEDKINGFPQELYVHEKFGEAPEWDGYETWTDAEEDYTIGIYRLVHVARVKKIKRTRLVKEDNHSIVLSEEAAE